MVQCFVIDPSKRLLGSSEAGKQFLSITRSNCNKDTRWEPVCLRYQDAHIMLLMYDITYPGQKLTMTWGQISKWPFEQAWVQLNFIWIESTHLAKVLNRLNSWLKHISQELNQLNLWLKWLSKELIRINLWLKRKTHNPEVRRSSTGSLSVVLEKSVSQALLEVDSIFTGVFVSLPKLVSAGANATWEWILYRSYLSLPNRTPQYDPRTTVIVNKTVPSHRGRTDAESWIRPEAFPPPRSGQVRVQPRYAVRGGQGIR